MLRKVSAFYLLRWCLLFVCCSVFSQAKIYQSNLLFNDFTSDGFLGAIIISDDIILYNTSDSKVYAIDKKEGKINWEIDAGAKSNTIPYLYNTTFFYGKYENGVLKCAQYDLKTGTKIKDLPFESLHTKPYFFNDIMYCTVLADGGKLAAYHLNENKILWQQNIGYGAEAQPLYLKDKIIANAADDNWFEIDYNGNFLKSKSKKQIYLDTNQIFVKNYPFLTHDGKEITLDFLKKNKFSNVEYKTKTTQKHTFLLSQNQLLVLGDNKKKVLQLDLEKEIPVPDFDPYAYNAILESSAESLWFYYQNHLLHYDFKNKKRLRKVDLTKWNPHQIAVENRTIWLLSKNDGQLYKLDFEPDQKTADRLEFKAKMDFERHRCSEPDPKMVEAIKAAQEEFQKRNQ